MKLSALSTGTLNSAVLAAAFLFALTLQSQAGVYQFTIQTASSTAALSSNISAPMAGTFKGDYDAKLNPAGTMTRPGLSGGSGNMPITYSGTITGGGDSQSNPAGAFRLDANTNAATAAISNFSMDALNGSNSAFPATFNILYQTFRTFQPNSTFFGGFTLPVPLGELTLDSLTISQSNDSLPGTLTSTGKNQYDFSVLVDAMISFSATFGGSTVSDQFPATILIEGSLTIAGNHATAMSTFNWSINETDTGPFEPFVDIPLDVPTIFPSGSTAHLLMSGTIQSINMQLGVSANLLSNGVVQKPGDINGDFIVNVNDLLEVINGWGACPLPCPPSCAADVTNDCVVNVNDLLVVINNWG